MSSYKTYLNYSEENQEEENEQIQKDKDLFLSLSKKTIP
jgi:hypothetical protein